MFCWFEAGGGGAVLNNTHYSLQQYICTGCMTQLGVGDDRDM